MSTSRNTWSYRVVRRAYGEHLPGETFLAIREAHDGEGKGRPRSIAKEPTTAQGETPEGLAEVQEMMRAALGKPVPWYDDF